MTNLFQTLISNPYIRAQILSDVRAAAMALGGILVAHGVGDASTAQALAGLFVALVSWYFSTMDVKGVDAKINAAIKAAPDSPPEVINALKNGKF